MSEAKELTIDDVVVPEGMFEAYCQDMDRFSEEGIRQRLAKAILWLMENPIEPTQDECVKLHEDYEKSNPHKTTPPYLRPTTFGAIKWQRRMFLKREPELPESVRNLLFEEDGRSISVTPTTLNYYIVAAYKIGKQIYGLDYS